jgi:hypothetical protein
MALLAGTFLFGFAFSKLAIEQLRDITFYIGNGRLESR